MWSSLGRRNRKTTLDTAGPLWYIKSPTTELTMIEVNVSKEAFRWALERLADRWATKPGELPQALVFKSVQFA